MNLILNVIIICTSYIFVGCMKYFTLLVWFINCFIIITIIIML